MADEHVINVERFTNRPLRSADDFLAVWQQVVQELEQIQQLDAVMAYTLASILRQAGNEFWRKHDRERGSKRASQEANRDPEDEPPAAA